MRFERTVIPPLDRAHEFVETCGALIGSGEISSKRFPDRYGEYRCGPQPVTKRRVSCQSELFPGPDIRGRTMIFRSPYPAVDVPRTPLHELILHRAAERQNLPVFIDPEAERTVTYGELARSVTGIAAGLYLRGMRKG